MFTHFKKTANLSLQPFRPTVSFYIYIFKIAFYSIRSVLSLQTRCKFYSRSIFCEKI